MGDEPVDSDDQETVECCYVVTIYTSEEDGIVGQNELRELIEGLGIVRSVTVERA